jgi:GAF domain-containing protein
LAAGLGIAVLFLCGMAEAQGVLPLESVTARRGSDYAAALEGSAVRVLGTVSSRPVSFASFSHLAIQDETGHGLFLEGQPVQFARLQPGDRVEVSGTVSRRAGLPVLLPANIRLMSRGAAPAPLPVSIAALRSFERLGVLVTVVGHVADKGENGDGEYLLIGDPNLPLKVFLLSAKLRSGVSSLARFGIGDKVRATGVAAQNCPFPPFNRSFEVIVTEDDGLLLLGKPWLVSPGLFAAAVVGLVFTLGLWWRRGRRLTAQRDMVRAFYGLGEEMTGASSPADVLRRLTCVLPNVLRVSGVHLYLYNRAAKTLDRVPYGPDGQPFSQPAYPPEGSLPLGAAACFRNQALLIIPETQRSPFFPDDRRGEQPGSLMFVPMFAETELVGVLEIFDSKPLHEFTPDERIQTQHLANQIALALRLIEEKSVREQLSRSEKLAAIGQLISGVAAELRSPLESISQLTESVMTGDASTAWNDLGTIAEEAHKASEIVSRLVSLVQPERTEAKRVELNSLLRSLIQFRTLEWEARGFEVQDELCPTPVYVLGSQGQLERVFLDLLIQAEQALSEASEKRLTIGSSVLARRALVEIRYGVNPLKGVRESEPSRESVAGVAGEGVSRGIVRSHGGEMRLLRVGEGECKLELELPVAPALLAGEAAGARPFTCLVVEPDASFREELVWLLTNRGCRVIPCKGAEEGNELAQRLRFDVVFCATQLPGLNWVEFSDLIRPQTSAFVLLSEGYDFELSRGLLSAETFVLTKPFAEPDLDQLLSVVESRISTSETAATRGLTIVRPDKKAISL